MEKFYASRLEMDVKMLILEHYRLTLDGDTAMACLDWGGGGGGWGVETTLGSLGSKLSGGRIRYFSHSVSIWPILKRQPDKSFSFQKFVEF